LSSGVSSTRNIRFDVATESCHFAGFSVTSDMLFRAANETVKVSFGYSVLLERVVIGVNRHGTESNDLIAVEDSDVLALRRSLQKRGEIATGLGRGQRRDASILRRYGKQLKVARCPTRR